MSKLENPYRVPTSNQLSCLILSKVVFHAQITSGRPVSVRCQIWGRYLKSWPSHYDL